MLLYNDNTILNNAQEVEDFIKKNAFLRISHHPYSPNLEPSDFGLFGTYFSKSITNTL